MKHVTLEKELYHHHHYHNYYYNFVEGKKESTMRARRFHADFWTYIVVNVVIVIGKMPCAVCGVEPAAALGHGVVVLGFCRPGGVEPVFGLVDSTALELEEANWSHTNMLIWFELWTQSIDLFGHKFAFFDKTKLSRKQID